MPGEPIPADWRQLPLARTSLPGRGGFDDGDWIEAPYITDSGTRLIQTGNIGVGEFLDKPGTKKFISEHSFKVLGCKWVHPGDILICRLADPIGRACVVPGLADDSVTAVDCTIYRPHPNMADSGYMLHRLNSAQHLKEAADTAGGSTRQRISRSNLGAMVVPLPHLPEQRRIAEILDTLDEAIRKTEQVIAKLQQMKQGLLHDILTRGIDDNGELRDPDRHPELFKDWPLGRIPRGWEVRPLKDLSVGGISNGVFKEPSRVGNGVPLVNVSDLYGPFGVDVHRCERFAATTAERSRFAARQGDIFFTRSSLNLIGIAHCNLLRNEPDGAVYECHLMRLRPDVVRINPEFLALWCRSHSASGFFMARAKQTTMTTIAQPDITPLPVPVPPLCEQMEIARCFDADDARICDERRGLEKLRTLKHGLMDDLLTGRVRVPVAEDAAR